MYGNIFTQLFETVDDFLQVTTGPVSLGKEAMIHVCFHLTTISSNESIKYEWLGRKYLYSTQYVV